VSDVIIKIEPRRLWPDKRFVFTPELGKQRKGNVRIINDSDIWRMTMRIPFEDIRLDAKDLHPIRMNIQIQRKHVGSSEWLANHPLPSRLMFGSDNPADLGWLIFQK